MRNNSATSSKSRPARRPSADLAVSRCCTSTTALSPEYRGEGVSRLAVGAVAAFVDDAAGDAGARGAAGVGLQVVGLLVDDHALADDAVDGDVGNRRLVISLAGGIGREVAQVAAVALRALGAPVLVAVRVVMAAGARQVRGAEVALVVDVEAVLGVGVEAVDDRVDHDAFAAGGGREVDDAADVVLTGRLGRLDGRGRAVAGGGHHAVLVAHARVGALGGGFDASGRSVFGGRLVVLAAGQQRHAAES